MLEFIGKIKTPYDSVDACPRNTGKDGPLCSLVLKKDYQDGLYGLQTGDKILILYWLEHFKNKNVPANPPTVSTVPMSQTSKEDGVKKGVFSLRSPRRPNPIGAAVVQIESITQNIVEVRGLDCVNGTMLLDIKPAIMDELS